jgi:hypothetical protein
MYRCESVLWGASAHIGPGSFICTAIFVAFPLVGEELKHLIIFPAQDSSPSALAGGVRYPPPLPGSYSSMGSPGQMPAPAAAAPGAYSNQQKRTYSSSSGPGSLMGTPVNNGPPYVNAFFTPSCCMNGCSIAHVYFGRFVAALIVLFFFCSAKKRASSSRTSTVDKAGKGLRHFSLKVCQKVKSKGITTYNEVSGRLACACRQFKERLAPRTRMVEYGELWSLTPRCPIRSRRSLCTSSPM